VVAVDAVNSPHDFMNGKKPVGAARRDRGASAIRRPTAARAVYRRPAPPAPP
jgi:hypothetical protein